MERRVKSLFLHSSLGQRKLPFIHSLNKYLFIIIFIIILPHCAAYRILVPRPGVELVHSALKGQSPNNWTAREVLPSQLLVYIKIIYGA